ncbi:DUF655 domain-containing protein [Castellaniella sp. GW247-6E4]|uniref:ComEA family DNA-binding protein n=1 Tax=Castellaniella sp. GW247-6E4 TaxID=3140380 RepID=UPI0033149A70
MNPFLHPTVAQPLRTGSRRSSRLIPPRTFARRRAPRGRRLARALGAAGLAAVTWSGGTFALDLNTATLAQLQGIRGIGPKTAQTIHHERERGGRYTSFEDLSDRVRGIGPRRADALRAAGLSIDTGPAALAAPPDAAGRAKASGPVPPRRP